MSFWNKSSAAAKNKAPVIRIEKVTVRKTVSVPKQTTRNAEPSRPPANGKSSAKPGASKVSQKDDTSYLRAAKRPRPSKRSPSVQPMESDSSSDEDETLSITSKRPRLESHEVDDVHRSLVSSRTFSERDSARLIHAAGIASIKQGFKPAFTGAQKEDCRVTLEYPGSDIPERYELVYRSDAFDPIEEIFGVVQEFAEFFVDEADRDVFLNPDRGIYRRLERARNLKSLEAFKTALNDYNEAVRVRRKAGTPQAILRKKHSLPESLIIRIMTQTYDRAVSPNVDLLRKYENGTNEIYGELKSNLVHKILVESKLDSKQVFVDLGSGVANVVLQAALQTGCESWGCEIMENACSLAEAQKKEFRARCRLWGIEPGNAYLEHGDFMANENIRKALLKADVVLVNNEVFTPTLNVSLVNLFLDLKEGCQIVSLKSFVPHNRKITNYNTNDPSNILRVERKTYSTKSVSWKDEGGEYFVATKDSARLKMYE